MKKICGFFKEYRFLSNFYEVPVEYNGLLFRSSEAAFQAQKCPERANEFVNLSPDEAKRMGRRIHIRKDWDEVKDAIMYEIVFAKFEQNPNLKKKLIETGNAFLAEENWWGDKYWGTVNGVGRNQLGKTLMEVRQKFINEASLNNK